MQNKVKGWWEGAVLKLTTRVKLGYLETDAKPSRKNMNREFTKKKIQMILKHMKRCSASHRMCDMLTKVLLK